ncbi:C4-type zinc ribbon domain-containing protein [Micromonospora globbae]|uniref:C4-type zinc ribbon domain-containing protein n=1 Tax=Micromonospora globbae TaxID=1894969 RepID=A0ABZ1S879_9ACTN|nr:C4-type zinc ribbon domain-containing protein [Micromonospora globbae]
MKADPQVQRRLLDLQAIDTALAQLAHRRRTLPERAELEALARELSALEDERVRAQVAVDDLDRDIARLEKDIDQVRARKEKDEARLAAGSGPARELEALQHELVSLNRRQSDLEDAELELMEQRETAQGVLDGVEQRLAEAREKRAATERRHDESLAEIAKEEEFRRSVRAPLAADLPSDLVALYDRIREDTGLGAALLTAGRCGGCRLELAGADLARIRAAAPDDVVRCEECRRIMVRTNESGL